MHELSFPAAITLPITDTLASIPSRRAAQSPNSPMYALRTGNGWTDVTALQFNDLVRSVARGIVARGIEVGQPVAILSPTRYEWTVLDFALWTAGAFAVPIYDSSSAEQIEWILQDSDAVAVITDSALSADRVRGATLSTPPPIWVMDDGLLDALVADGARDRRRGPHCPVCGRHAPGPGNHRLHVRGRRAGPRAASSPTRT